MVCIRTFCSCYTLKTGTIIAGAISLMLSVLFLYLMICCILVMEEVEQVMTKATNRSLGDADPQLTKVRHLFVGGSVIAAITLAASILLIVGAVKKHMPLLIPWMVVSTIDLILSFVVVVVWLTAIGSVIKPSSLEEVGFDIICLIGGIVLTIYLLTVVCSHFKELKQRKMEGSAEI